MLNAKFFEFEEFSIKPFFCSCIQPQHTVSRISKIGFFTSWIQEGLSTNFGSVFLNQIKPSEILTLHQNYLAFIKWNRFFDNSTTVCSSDKIPIGEVVFSGVFSTFSVGILIVEKAASEIFKNSSRDFDRNSAHKNSQLCL